MNLIFDEFCNWINNTNYIFIISQCNTYLNVIHSRIDTIFIYKKNVQFTVIN